MQVLAPRADGGSAAGSFLIYTDIAAELLSQQIGVVDLGGRPFPDAPSPPASTASTVRFEWAPGTFPWYHPQSGAFQGGTLDLWAIRTELSLHFTAQDPVLGNLGHKLGVGITSFTVAPSSAAMTAQNVSVNLIRSDLRSKVYFLYSGIGNLGPTAILNVTGFISIRSYAPETVHRLQFTLDGATGQVVGYVDGVPDPGLFATLDGYPPQNPFYPTALRTGEGDDAWTGGQNRMSSLRLYAGAPLSQLQLMAFSQKPFYWDKVQDPDLPGVPSFLSPLQVFDHPTYLERVRWEGFVPRTLRTAATLWSLENPGVPKVPLGVELWIYANASDPEPRWKLPVLDGAWTDGGGRSEFRALWEKTYGSALVPKIGALRYRVAMDADLGQSLGNESPIFDGITISYRSGKRLSLSER